MGRKRKKKKKEEERQADMSTNWKSISLTGTLALLIIIGAFAVAWGQVHTKRVKIEGDLFFIPELGAIVVDGEEAVKVEFIAPADRRVEDYKDVDLETGDLIIMFNGKKIKTVADFKKIYSDLEIGAGVKLGIRRDKSMMIASFPKADESKLPDTGLVIKTSVDDGDDGKDYSSTGNESGAGMKMLKIDVDDGALLSLIDIGIILEEGENSVTVQILMPDAGEAVVQSGLKEGDVLRKVQGETVSTPEEIEDRYSKISPGDAVELTFSREGSDIVLKYDKPVGQKKFIMKRQ